MIILLIVMSITPFYEANFTSLPSRSISVFSNPAGMGIQPGAEGFFVYHPEIILTGISLGNIGLGMTKLDSITYYETGLGLKLPGTFTLGYAYQNDFSKDHDISNHIFGLICRANQYLVVGYKTTLSERKHMFGGISITTPKEYLTLSFDLEYEGIDSIFTYYYGAMIKPKAGVKLNFHANENFDWNAGAELSSGYIKIAGEYSSFDKKFSVGVILSAQSHESIFSPKTDNYEPEYE